jgi:hypothetical protein
MAAASPFGPEPTTAALFPAAMEASGFALSPDECCIRKPRSSQV